MIYPSSNIEIAEYSNYKPRFNDVFSRDSLPKKKMQCTS